MERITPAGGEAGPSALGGGGWMRAAGALQAAAWVVLQAALVAAPWMYGSTRPWALVVLCQMLSIIAGCWVTAAWVTRGVFVRDVYLALPLLFLLLSGWLGVLTGLRVEPDPFNTKHFADLAQRWPGSFLVKTPLQTMWLFSGLFGVLLLVTDPMVGPKRRDWAYRTMVVVGASIILLGIVQVQFKAPAMLWDSDVPITGYFFATFFEDSIGASFISMIWPLAAGGLIGRFGLPRAMNSKELRLAAVWAGLLVISLAGLPAEGSIFAMVNGLFLGALFLGWILWRLPLRDVRRISVRGGLVFVVCLCVMAGVIVAAGKAPVLKSRLQSTRLSFQTQAPAERQASSPPAKKDFRMRADGLIESSGTDVQNHGFFSGPRAKVAAICLRMVPHAGLLGFGPGTWSQTYPLFTDDTLLRTFYLQMQFASQDYLQTLVEWGIFGSIAWAVIIGGAIRGGWYRLRRFRMAGGAIGVEEGMVAGALVAVVGVGLHALVDFPMQVPSIQLYVMVLLGLLWSSGPRQRSTKAGRPREDVASKPAGT